MTKTAAARRKTNKLTRVQLMATPRHMLAWLSGMPPRAIVTRDLLDNERCLCANFVKAHGHSAEDLFSTRLPLWARNLINALPVGKPITAKRALAALAKAEA